MSRAFLFPGQGSQHVGMAVALAEREPLARETLAHADDVLGFSLSSLMADGPEEELTATINAQPALLAHSVAVLRVLGDRLGHPLAAAGHSLGEFSAHVAAGTLSFDDALRAVRRRGELMHRTGTERPGTMAALLGLDDDAVEEVCGAATEGVCVPANFNSAGQVVVSGDVAAVHEVMELAREAGARKAVELNVSGAFHSPLMEPAAAGLEAFLAEVDMRDPDVPVISNATAEPVTTAEDARALLVRQLTSPVRWAQSVQTMLGMGVETFYEIGPGKVLTGLNRRNARGAETSPLGTPEQLDGLEA